MIEEFYKRKIIRDFLSLFSEIKWKELLFLLVEYGVIHLKRNNNVASMSLDDFNTIVDDLKEEENKRLKKNMKKFEKNEEKEIINKPSSNWRKGDTIKFDNRSTSKNKQISKNKSIKKIYPDWWEQQKPKWNMDKIIEPITSKITGQKKSLSRYQTDIYKKDRSKSSDTRSVISKSKYEAESKIKNRVETDKKIYNLLKNRNENSITDSSANRNTNQSFYKESQTQINHSISNESFHDYYRENHRESVNESINSKGTNYLIEFDKGLEPQKLKEKKNSLENSKLITASEFCPDNRFTYDSIYYSNHITRNDETIFREEKANLHRYTNSELKNISDINNNESIRSRKYNEYRDNETVTSPHFNNREDQRISFRCHNEYSSYAPSERNKDFYLRKKNTFNANQSVDSTATYQKEFNDSISIRNKQTNQYNNYKENNSSNSDEINYNT